jgi:hypothetical protein
VLSHPAEESVRRIPDVAACRIRTDPSGDVLGVDVTIHGAREAGDVLADVLAVLSAAAGLDVQPEDVHVVTLGVPPGEAGSIEPEPELEVLADEHLERLQRARLVAVRTSSDDERSNVEVDLALGPQSARGHAACRGPVAAPDLLAQACLDALEKLVAARVVWRLAGLRRVTVGDVTVVCVAVSETEGRVERRLVGAARHDGDTARAAAYAALGAVNRRLGRILSAPARQLRID